MYVYIRVYNPEQIVWSLMCNMKCYSHKIRYFVWNWFKKEKLRFSLNRRKIFRTRWNRAYEQSYQFSKILWTVYSVIGKKFNSHDIYRRQSDDIPSLYNKYIYRNIPGCRRERWLWLERGTSVIIPKDTSFLVHYARTASAYYSRGVWDCGGRRRRRVKSLHYEPPLAAPSGLGDSSWGTHATLGQQRICHRCLAPSLLYPIVHCCVVVAKHPVLTWDFCFKASQGSPPPIVINSTLRVRMNQ